jgi:hypothetical protein
MTVILPVIGVGSITVVGTWNYNTIGVVDFGPTVDYGTLASEIHDLIFRVSRLPQGNAITT